MTWIAKTSNDTVQQANMRVLPIFNDYDNELYASLKKRQDINDKDKDTLREHTVIPAESTVEEERRWWTMDMSYSNRAWHTRPQQQIIQDIHDKDRIHHDEDNTTSETDTNNDRTVSQRSTQ